MFPITGTMLLLFSVWHFWPMVLFSIILFFGFLRLIWLGPVLIYFLATDDLVKHRLLKAFALSIIWVSVSIWIIFGANWIIGKSVKALVSENYEIWGIMRPHDFHDMKEDNLRATEVWKKAVEGLSEIMDTQNEASFALRYQDMQKQVATGQKSPTDAIDFIREMKKDLSPELELKIQRIPPIKEQFQRLKEDFGNVLKQDGISQADKALSVLEAAQKYYTELKNYFEFAEKLLEFVERVGDRAQNNELTSAEQKEMELLLKEDMRLANDLGIATDGLNQVRNNY